MVKQTYLPHSLGALAKLRKANISFLFSVCIKQLGSHWRDFDYIWCLMVFRNPVETKFSKYLKRITRTLHQNLFTFQIIFRCILLRVGNISDRSCRENKSTYFMSSNFFYSPKTVPVMTYCKKIR